VVRGSHLSDLRHALRDRSLDDRVARVPLDGASVRSVWHLEVRASRSVRRSCSIMRGCPKSKSDRGGNS
jgi:hypothetical protein